MRWLLGGVVACGLACVPNQALAKNDMVLIAPPPAWAHAPEAVPVPDDARGAIFMRRNDVEAHLDKSGEFMFASTVVRILDTNALQLGNIAISWNPASGSPVVHAIKIHRGATVIDVLAATKFEILRRENQLEEATLDGVLTAVLKVPDLRVGDDLEIEYTLPAFDPTLGANSYGVLFLGAVPPPGRMSLRLSWDPGQEPVIKPTADMAAALKREPQAISIVFDQPAPLSPPKDAPQRYNWQRTIEFGDFSAWADVSRLLDGLFVSAAQVPAKSPIHDEAAAIASSHPGAYDRAAAALKLVQQQVRYVYVGLNGGNLTPVAADETWQRRYGDCKGKTVLLLALLKDLGIEAEPVLVNNSGGDDGLDGRLPSPMLFDHVLVRARIDGRTYWLDGTLPPVYPPTTAPVLPYRWVLPLSASGTNVERVAWAPATKPNTLQLVEIDARDGFAPVARRRIVSITRGLDGIKEYLTYSAVPANQLEAAFRQQVEGSEAWTTVDKVSWHFDIAEQASVLDISGTGPVDWDKQSQGSRSMILPGGGFNPPRRRQRAAASDPSVPYAIEPEFDCRLTVVKLPSATAAKDWSYNTSFSTALFGQQFQRKFERRDGAIRMIRSNRTMLPEIDAAAAAHDNALIDKFDNSMALIFYTPRSYDRPRAAPHIPALDEVDWVADENACLISPAPAK